MPDSAANCSTCPNCGFDLERIERLELGDLEIVHGCEVLWKGEPVKLTQSEALIVVLLARTAGAWVNTAAIANAVAYRGDHLATIVSVHICRIRKAFRAIDPAFDYIERRYGKAIGALSRWRV